jgi:hypothetical protein
MALRAALLFVFLLVVAHASCCKAFYHHRRMTMMVRNSQLPAAIDDSAALKAMEQLEKLDQRFGIGCGAQKERAKLTNILLEWEKEQIEKDDDQEEEEEEDDQEEEDDDQEEEEEEEEGCSDSDENDDEIRQPHHVGVSFERHSASDRVAIFGGNPARRRRQIEKRFTPYQKLDHFGTPRDAGSNDVTKLVQRIRSGSYDIVYLWTRFGCHQSRARIKMACSHTDTRFVEFESLSSIQDGL